MESARPLDVLTSGLLGFGHPVRIRALVLMENGQEWSPRELAQALNAPLGVTSYHVRMLRDYGLVELAHTEPVRGALAHFYRRTTLADELLHKLNGTLGVPDRPKGRFTKAAQAQRREQLAEWASAAA